MTTLVPPVSSVQRPTIPAPSTTSLDDDRGATSRPAEARSPLLHEEWYGLSVELECQLHVLGDLGMPSRGLSPAAPRAGANHPAPPSQGRSLPRSRFLAWRAILTPSRKRRASPASVKSGWRSMPNSS